MPRFVYQTAAGTQGSLMADSARDARDQLRAQGQVVLQMRPETDARSHTLSFRARRQLTRQMPMTLRELATLLRVGIPLMEALSMLESQAQGPLLISLQHLKAAIANGASLAEAMEAQHDAFEALTRHMVAVGEQSGQLADVLQRLGEYHEQSRDFKGGLMGALSYPLLVFGLGLIVTLFLMTWVVPQLVETLESLGKPLPLLTLIIKRISDTLVYQWWLVLGLAGGTGGCLWWALRKPSVRLQCEKTALNTPVLGSFMRHQATARIAFVLSTLLDTGIPADKAFELTAAGHPGCFGHALDRALQATREGNAPDKALAEQGAFGPAAIRVFTVGLQSGELAQMLTILAEESRQHARTFSRRLTGLLEPLLICAVAAMVLTIALATLLPILEIGHAL